MNVFEFAMQMEDNGYTYYQDLAQKATVPGLKTIFASLAADEKKHHEIFRNLRDRAGVDAMPESTALDTAQNIFKLLPRGDEGLKDVADVLQAYQHAMKLEADSFRFYQETAEKEEDTEVKELLLRIAVEEQEHFNIIENVYHFVNAPNQSLEWGEYSNISEFHQYGRDVDR